MALDATHRVARLLLEQVSRRDMGDDNEVDVDLPLTQHELAGLAAASRESVVRALTSLRSRGLITTLGAGSRSAMWTDCASTPADRTKTQVTNVGDGNRMAGEEVDQPVGNCGRILDHEEVSRVGALSVAPLGGTTTAPARFLPRSVGRCLLRRTLSTGWVTRSASLGPKLNCCTAGISAWKNRFASPSASSKAPGAPAPPRRGSRRRRRGGGTGRLLAAVSPNL